MHFLSDLNETFGDLMEKEHPFTFMLACDGYLMSMLVNCVISYVVVGRESVRDVREGDQGENFFPSWFVFYFYFLYFTFFFGWTSIKAETQSVPTILP